MVFFYNFFIHLLIFGLKVFSLFNEKARKGVIGRKQSFSLVQKIKNEKVIWMHAASLGEYEQGLPILEGLKEKFPQYKILVTFFSPSGYENMIKKKHIADVVCYLPFDKKNSIQRFTTQFKTEIFFTVKYDFWYHLLAELKKQGVKTFVVSALFYEEQVFFKPWGKWFVEQLKQNIDWLFHQTKHSETLAKSVGLAQSSISGDLRFDRVKQIREWDNFVPFIEEFKGDKKLVVFGSSWKSEDKIAKIIAEKSPETKIIIAPHDIKREMNFENAVFYSHLSEKESANSQCLIIDSIGLLSKIYSYADIAVVGGGFHSAGLHNILEAATFGIPVVYGNRYKKNPEADDLIKNNGGQSFSTEEAAADFILTLIENKERRQKMSENARNFVNDYPNAKEIILEKVLEFN